MKSCITNHAIGRVGRLARNLAYRVGTLAAVLALLPHGEAVGQATSPPSGYCTTQHLNMSNNGCVNNYGFNFLKVGLNDWEHSVNCNTNTVYRYWNSMGSVFNLAQGGEYEIIMQTASTTYTTGAGAWIDYNQDGTFQSSEYIGSGKTGTTAPVLKNTFTVPCNAKAGQTILRYRCDYNVAVTASMGCGNVTNNYGETMDYIVTISATQNVSSDFSIPDSIYTNSPARFINANQVGYIGHEWDVLNQGGSVDATSTNLKWTFPSAGNYQVRLASTNCKGTAIKTKNITVINPTSSPRPEFVLSENQVIFDGVNPILVDFYDLTTGGPTSWYWIMNPDWLNGAPYFWSSGSEFDQNPQGFFYDVETYDVCLVVSNSAGTDTLCKAAYLEIANPGAGSSFSNILGQQTGSDRDSGLIYDSGGPVDPYKENEYYEFLIAPCGANEVRLTFLEFNFGANDVLYVYDGNSSSADEIGSFTGTNLPNTVVSSGGALYLVMVTDNSGNGPGFKATWGSSSPNNGNPTADFMLPDTVYQCAIGNEVRFRNTSTGIVEGQASYDWIFDYDPNVNYPAGYADVKDETNPEYQYIGTGTYLVRMVLKSCEGYDTVVKPLILTTTAGNPVVDFSASETITKVNQIITLEEMAVAGCEYEWVINPATYTIENGGSVNDSRIQVKFTQPGSYNIKLIVDNDNGSSFLEKTNYVDVIEYCVPGVFYPTVADAGINDVIVGTINNSSTSGQLSGYTDYSETHFMEMILGQTYHFNISRNTTVNAVDRKIWIDYNRDGDFNDAGELVASESNSTTPAFDGTFVVPGLDDVVLGETRMRIGSSLAGGTFNACGPVQVGEYEDYGIVLIRDNQAPVITLTGTDVAVEVNTVYNDAGATAFDNIEGNITSEIVVDNGVDMSQAGVYLVTYSVTDKSGNTASMVTRTVTVVNDLTKPVLTLNGGTPLMWSVLVPYADPGATALDDPGAQDISSNISLSGTVDETTIGDYPITYTVYDSYGNMTSEVRIVQVRDTTAPKIVSDPVVHVQVERPFVDPVMATDNFDMNVKAVRLSGSINPNVVGTYTQTYSATDFSGNQAVTTTVTFEVADYIPPTIHFVPGTEVVLVDVFDNEWMNNPGMGVTVTDNYFAFADLELIYPAGFSINKIGTYVITYKATDNGGNEATFERTLVVVDRDKPIVVTDPLNLPRWEAYDFMQGVSVKDNYNTPLQFANGDNGCQILILRNNVDVNYPGIYEVSYIAIDESGNRSKETIRMVQVSEKGTQTGVEEVLDNRVQVYPNPSNGVFTLEVAGMMRDRFRVNIVDAMGKTIRVLDASAFENGAVSINLSGVASGVYFVRVSDGDQSTVKRITIQ